MSTNTASTKAEKSYLSSAVDSFNPWASGKTSKMDNNHESSTPVPAVSAEATSSASIDDHTITHLYGQSFKTYPKDCPPLNVQWFHAVDVAKRKPQLDVTISRQRTKPNTKTLTKPKKFSSFSAADSKVLENRYQTLLEDAEKQVIDDSGNGDPAAQAAKYSTSSKPGAAEVQAHKQEDNLVPVNEDYLFDVDIDARELRPAYWLGPVYEVRRGTWFVQDGSGLRPCEENLAAQLEEGYLKVKPWLNPVRSRSSSGSKVITPKASTEKLTSCSAKQNSPVRNEQHKGSKLEVPSSVQGSVSMQPHTYRLFGAYMNSVVTFQDGSVAWLSSDSMLSWVTSSVYERFSGGGYLSGMKLIRGYTEPVKDKAYENPQGAETPALGVDEKQQMLLKRRSAPPSTRAPDVGQDTAEKSSLEQARSKEEQTQERLASLFQNAKGPAAQLEDAGDQLEQEVIQDDYNIPAGEKQGRDIEHLVLVTHGIGQLLGLRMESVNFVHDVNVLRKTLKSVYANSADLKALNSEFGTGPGNCRVQVLPVCWRHMLEFPKRRRKRGEHDLGDATLDEEEYPSLDDITVEGVAFARSLISDLALDVLLYQSSYRGEISKIVLRECNRIFKLFCSRNPEFHGKVHLVGHSLGSAIFFDILCRQPDHDTAQKASSNPLRFWPSQSSQTSHRRDRNVAFDFDVEDFYCLGSPVGLFQMLKGRTISARQPLQAHQPESPLVSPDDTTDQFLRARLNVDAQSSFSASETSFSVSSPKVSQLFNIFHPSDPISYRLEPLISPAMSVLKPQVLPYTKKGIFGTVAPQGLSGLGVKVGQSVSGLWSSFSAGIANNLLNRSLGLTNEEVARMTADSVSPQQHVPTGGSTDASGAAVPNTKVIGVKVDERKRRLADSAGSGMKINTSGDEPTLIDEDLETLYSRYHKDRVETSSTAENHPREDDEGAARQMRREENKVRALNRNGRVDFNIQESVLDFNPVNTIASHMCYWSDEDVNHFVLSQILSRKNNNKSK